MSEATEAATIRLENRALQALLVATVGTLSWLLVAMFDRLEGDIVDLTDSISALEDENAERDSKLAELVLQIEHRLTVLENQ